jgi:hypothetical protein
MDFFYSTEPGFYDFVVTVGVCAVGLLSPTARGMAISALAIYLATRTLMATVAETQQFVGASVVMLICGLSLSLLRPFKVSYVFAFLCAVGMTGYTLRVGEIIGDDILEPWLVAVAALQLLLIAGGASVDGLRLLAGKPSVHAGAVRARASSHRASRHSQN